jgi:hypothetical protein
MERDTFPLGCYGKLPFWPEYLKENVSFPSSRKLVAWIHEGRSEASLAESDDPGQAEPPPERARLRLLYGEPGATEIVAGVIRPSADQGGLRKFPFMVLTHLPRRLFAGSYPLLPMALAPVWEALDEAWERLASVASREAFQEIAGSHRVPSPLPPREVEREYRARQQEKMAALLDRGDGASLEQLARNMPDLLGRIRKEPGTFRVELPVSADPANACLDTSFWIDLLNAQFRFRRVEPAVFLDEDPGTRDRKVLLVLAPLAAADYPAVMNGGVGHPGILRPAHAPAGGEGAVPLPAMQVTYAEMLARRF